MTKIVVLIVAGGVGGRCKGYDLIVPKQYATIKDKPILTYTIEKFLNNKDVSLVRTVIREDHKNLYEQAVSLLPDAKLLHPIYGGKRRQDSVRFGLESIVDVSPDIVIIHDACRPFIADKTISDIISFLSKNCETTQGVVPATAVTDTIRVVVDNSIKSHVCRNTVKALQTPQAFKFNDILTCHKLAYSIDPGKEFTDDSSVMMEFNKSVAVINGDDDNLKITTKEDLYTAQILQKVIA
ncbi:IspD/TarI family cytidylyltransferase [Candidatus Mesenet endosymbiont of Agriotes lineatus]|uniref:IspD/TarI family cytidylyltransferase n=1 Tax=Candidatus Mesenet endosymbiont of Agriotes lineatus TaxID=3077948 RepID=UPI0030D59D84